MAKQDINKSWWGAPTTKYWKCPECKNISPTEQWEEREVFCEDCGDHDGRRCPHCNETQDHVSGAEKIEGFDSLEKNNG